MTEFKESKMEKRQGIRAIMAQLAILHQAVNKLSWITVFHLPKCN